MPTTPTSASHVDRPTRQNRRQAIEASAESAECRRLAAPAVQHRQRHDRRQHTDDAQHHHAELQWRRRGDEPGVDVDARRQARLSGHLEVGEHAGDLRLLLRGQRAGGAGDADEVGADAAGVGPDVQGAAGAGRPRRAAAPPRPPSHGTRRRRRRRWRVTNSPLRLASMPAGGMVENTRPPAAGSVATARQGIETSRACGAPDTSGAVMSLTARRGRAPAARRWWRWSA